jgi:hypothetical protein
VHDRQRRHPQRPELGRGALGQRDDAQVEGELDLGEMLERRLERAHIPALDAGRPGKRERARALAEMRLEHEVGDAAEMIAVEMRDQDRVDGAARNAEPLEPDQRGGAAIDQKVRALAHHVEAGVEAAARAERVPAADELQMHGGGFRRHAVMAGRAWRAASGARSAPR